MVKCQSRVVLQDLTPSLGYTYDAASRLTQVAQGSLAVGLGYDNANRRTSLMYPNGTSTSYTYDVASKLTNINHLGPSGMIEALTYQYDAAGNRTSLTRNNAAASLLPSAVASATYDAANEQTAFAGATLTYDNNGNLTSDGVNTYVWDARNRLVSISGGATATFNYDALGRRTGKVINSVASSFLYDGNDIAAEIGGGAIGSSYLRSLNIDESYIRQTGTGNEHYHTDAQGSPLALSNAQGGSATTYSYEPFGKTTVTGTSSNALQYTGRENDQTGLYQYRARYYAPALHRFLGEDPIRLSAGQVNYYSYVSNNPTKFSDPYGLYFTPWHPALTYLSMLSAGHPIDGFVAAWYSGTADRWSTQDTLHANQHGMGIPGQTLEEAEKGTAQFINDEIGKCTFKGLGNAVHASQDIFAPGHGYTTWDGLPDPKDSAAVVKFILHQQADWFPPPGAVWDSIKKSRETFSNST